MRNHKQSDEYGDYKREGQRDKNIMASEDKVEFVRIFRELGWWQCTDGKNFESRNNAIDHQYNIERGTTGNDDE